MPRRKKGSVPSYRHHKARDLAVVTINGRDIYLGKYGSAESKKKYSRLIEAWQQQQEQDPCSVQTIQVNSHSTINDLILSYLKHAKDYYKPNRGENKEAGCIADALEVLQGLCGRDLAEDFRPKDLKTVRQAMIDNNWSRNYVNHQISRIKRMFAFAVEEDLIPGSVYHALLAVKGLRKGTPGVRETKKVKPVAVKHIKAVLELAHPVLKDMIYFSYYTGARPGEVCSLKPCYLIKRSKIWIYEVPPDANKTEHHDQERKIFIGPKAQKILKPWLGEISQDEFVFSPIRAEQIRNAERRKNRKTPLWPSHLKKQNEKRKKMPKRCKRDHYDPRAFRQAVIRLCKKAKVPEWSPNQLRHNAATRFRKKYGVEIARILLGHRNLSTTEIYAERDVRKARKAIGKIG